MFSAHCVKFLRPVLALHGSFVNCTIRSPCRTASLSLHLVYSISTAVNYVLPFGSDFHIKGQRPINCKCHVYSLITCLELFHLRSPRPLPLSNFYYFATPCMYIFPPTPPHIFSTYPSPHIFIFHFHPPDRISNGIALTGSKEWYLCCDVT